MARTPTPSFMGDRLQDDQIKEDITCKACGQEYKPGDRLPKIMPCLHTVCSACINKSAGGVVLCEKVQCPLCKIDCVCPQGSILNFRTSSYRNMLIDIVECHELEKKGMLPCIGCQAPARYRCLACNENYCQSHTDFHTRSRATADHKLLTFRQILKSPKLISTIKQDESCVAHPTRSIDLFCFDCKTPVCTACALSTHKTHNCAGVSEAIMTLKKKFDGAKPKFNQKIYGLRQTVSTLKNTERQVDIDSSNALKKITDMIEKCVRELRQKEMLLSHAIEDKRKDNIVELKIQIAAIEEEIMSIESGVEFIDNVFDNWNALEVLSIENNIVGRLQDLSVTELSLEPVTVEPMEFAIDNKEHVQEAIKGVKNTAIDHTEMKAIADVVQKEEEDKKRVEKEERKKERRARRKGSRMSRADSVSSQLSMTFLDAEPFFVTEKSGPPSYPKAGGKYTEKGGKYVDKLEEEGYIPSALVEYEPDNKPSKEKRGVNREVSLI